MSGDSGSTEVDCRGATSRIVLKPGNEGSGGGGDGTHDYRLVNGGRRLIANAEGLSQKDEKLLYSKRKL